MKSLPCNDLAHNKYHLLVNNTKERFQIKIGNKTVGNNKYAKLLGIKVDHEIDFNEHVSSLGSSTELMNDVFEFIEKPYSIRTILHFRSKRIRTRK